MELEGQARPAEAAQVFAEAWEMATTDLEKFTAAHYVARHQNSVSDKLKWDETALHHALNMRDTAMKGVLPSLYLNVGKGYEDLNDWHNAQNNYQAALSCMHFLPDDGYGNMIKAGIRNGLDRISKHV
jgi:rifampin ADP-ribosylating transferase